MSTKNTHELKGLQTKKRRLEASLGENNSEEVEIQKKKKELQKEITEVQKKIDKLTQKDIIISEHAFLRYLERVEGIDLEVIREKILTKGVKAGHKAFGNGKFPQDGFQVIIKNNTVVTVQTKTKE